jgi:hypothetical protein
VIPDAIGWTAEHRLLPEAYLYGLLHTYENSRARRAFLDGQVTVLGFRSFFLYTALYKTPLTVMLVIALGAAAVVVRWVEASPHPRATWLSKIGDECYRVAPLLVLIAVYGGASLSTPLNIGHRHILPLYPPAFILAGSACAWLRPPWRWGRGLVPVALLLLALENFRIWPDYLAYFNPIAGGPRNGYHHLVDSSLDWGQDLPNLARWLKQERLDREGGPQVYLSYFGPTNPDHYGIRAKLLPGFPHPPKEKVVPLDLKGGTYCLSASILHTVVLRIFGVWSVPHEEAYQELLRLERELAKVEDDALSRDAFIANELKTLRARAMKDESRVARELVERIDRDPQRAWRNLLSERSHNLGYYQMARLAAYLRTQEFDAQVGYSILIYRLSDEQVEAALYGPPAELATWPTLNVREAKRRLSRESPR